MEDGYFLNIDSWKRSSQYYFFKEYDIPFFNICSEIEVTETLNWCRENEKSFALACWYLCQRAVNLIEEFRYRILDDKVWVHDRISVGTTILNGDETFRFCYFPYGENFDDFYLKAKEAIGLPVSVSMDARLNNTAMIHGTSVPWIKFNSVTHPRKFGYSESIPKITFGKYFETHGKVKMPISAEVHHALMDGIHVSKFFQHMENEMTRPEEVLENY